MHPFLQNNENINTLNRRVKRVAKRFGKDPEDLFQDIALFLLEHPKSTASLRQITIDILRRRSGRSDDNNYEIRKNFMKAGSIDNIKEALLGISDPEDKLNAQLDIKKAWPKLTEKQQNLIHSLFFLGLTGSELSRERDVTEAMISSDKYRTFNIIKEELERQ